MRGIGDDSFCLLCNHDSVDILHVLKDCPAAKEVMLSDVLANHQLSFFSSSLFELIESNLCNLLGMPNEGINWTNLFGLIVWCIWKNKNLFVFQGITWSSSKTIKLFVSWNK